VMDPAALAQQPQPAVVMVATAAVAVADKAMELMVPILAAEVVVPNVHPPAPEQAAQVAKAAW